MTEAERQALREEICEIVSEAVAEAMAEALADHAKFCRFSESEAKLVHQLPEDVDRNALISLGKMARAWDAGSVWIGRVLLFALLALMVWGLTKLNTLGVPKP